MVKKKRVCQVKEYLAKINIGNWNIKVSSAGQNVAPDEKMFWKLTGQKLRKVRKFFSSSQSSDFFVIFDRLPGRVGGGGAKSHSAGAPWWIMKVIWKFEDKCPTFIICSGEGGGAWPELFFETPLPLPREPSKLSVFLPFQIIWSAWRAFKVYKDKDFGFLSLFPEFDNQCNVEAC